MSRKRLNPFEKEFLIRQFRENSSLKLREFCEANRVTPQTFRKWMDQYDAAGIEGLSRGSRYPDLLPGSLDPTVENYKKEILRLTIENERLKKNYAVRTTPDGRIQVQHLEATTLPKIPRKGSMRADGRQPIGILQASAS